MPYEIILGRTDKEKEQHGLKGTVFIAKQYVKMGQQTTLSQPIYLDINNSHVVFVTGKRGTGKSYCISVIAEGIATIEEDLRKKLSVLLIDTMGIFWTMKYPNHREEHLLREWGLQSKPIENTKIYTPHKFHHEYKEQGIPTDEPFSIKPSELNPEDWNLTFELHTNDPLAVYIERIILTLKKKKQNYTIDDILTFIHEDTPDDPHTQKAVENRFLAVKEWGVFYEEATPITDLIKEGQINILDLSCYTLIPNGWRIKHIVLGLICNKAFMERMRARKQEELTSIQTAIHYLSKEKQSELPLIWIMLDEAHEFLPKTGKTTATDALVTLLREGRQPGISLILATQQPGKIHTDAMTQADILLAHRITAKIDTDALATLVQSYLRTGLEHEMETLPKVPGAAIAVDDVNERIHPLRIRPRYSWHGGSAPELISEEQEFNI